MGAVPVLAVAAGAARPADVVGAAAAGYRSVVVSVGSAVSAQVADLAVLARSHLRVNWVPDVRCWPVDVNYCSAARLVARSHLLVDWVPGVRCWPEGVNFRLAERSAVHFHSPADSEWAVHYWPAVVANCPAVR